MANPTVREVVTGVNLYSQTPHGTITATTSAAVQAGDTLVAVYGLDYGAADQTPGPTADAQRVGPWSKIGQSSFTGAVAPHLQAWSAQVLVTGAQAITITDSDTWADALLCVLVLTGTRGASGQPWSTVVTGLGTASSAHVATGYTPTDADELMVCAWLEGTVQNDVGNYAVPAGMTKRAEVDAGLYSTMMVATQGLASNAATGNKTATFTRSTVPATTTKYVTLAFGIRSTEPKLTDSTTSPLALASSWTASKRATASWDSSLNLDSARVQGKHVAVHTDSDLALNSLIIEDKDEQALPAGGPIDLSIWGIADDGTYIPLPDTETIDISPIANGVGTVRITYPFTGLNFPVLHDIITDDKDLEIAIWVGGRNHGSMRAILTDATGDEVDEDAVWTLTGSTLEMRMGEAILYPADIQTATTTTEVTNADGTKTSTTTTVEINPQRETIFENATAGKVLRALVNLAHARGALTDIDATSFTDLAGSNGVLFTRQATLKLSPGQTLLTILGNLVKLGLCEWEVSADHRLRLYEPDTRGKDRTVQWPPIVLRAGKDVTDSPRTFSTKNTATNLLLSGKDALYQEASDSIAQTRRGRRIEAYQSQGSIADQGTLLAYGEAALAAKSTGNMELSHGLTFAEGGPVPVADFDVFDWVWSDQGWGLERLRVAQWRISQDKDGDLSGGATLNDVTSDWEEALSARLAALEGGTTVVGTPSPGSPPPANDYKRPAVPTGLTASSLVYTTLDTPPITAATVTAGWSGVVLNEDGTALTVTPFYRVRYRYTDGPGAGTSMTMWPGGPNGWQYDTGDTTDWIAGAEGPTTVLSFSGLSPGRHIDVQVATVIPLNPPGPPEVDDHQRAFQRTILQSHWSPSFSLVTDQDIIPPAPPATPDVSEYLGTVRIAWTGLDLDGLPMAADLASVEVHVSPSSNFTPDASTYRDTIYGAGGATVVSDLLYGVTYFARLVAVDFAGNRSLPSAQGAATTWQLLGDDIFAGAVGTAQLADAAITNAKIAKLAVNDAQIQNLSVGKLVSGLMTANMVLAGVIKTAETGARIEFDATSFRQYDAGNILKTQFVGATGEALVTGTIRSAITGSRFELSPDGTLKIFPPSGTNYSAMFNYGNEVVFRGQLDVNGKAGYLRLNSTGMAMQFGTPQIGAVEAQLTVQAKNIDLTSPVNGLRSDKRFPTADGAAYRNVLLFNDSSGSDIATSVTQHKEWNSSTIGFHFSGRNGFVGFNNQSYSTNRMVVLYNDGNFSDVGCGNLYAPNVVAPSGISVKRRITDVPYEALNVVRTAPAMEWEYDPAVTKKEPTDDARPLGKIRRRKPGTPVDTHHDDDFELVDAEAPTPTQPKADKRRVGPMADHIQAVAPQMVHVEPDGSLGLSLGDMIGVLWKAVEQLSDKVDSITDKFPDISELPGRKPKPGGGGKTK